MFNGVNQPGLSQDDDCVMDPYAHGDNPGGKFFCSLTSLNIQCHEFWQKVEQRALFMKM